MTKLPELPEEIIGYILSFAPNYRDRLKACQSELLENKPIYYSTFEMVVDTDRNSNIHITIDDVLNMRGGDAEQYQIKYINGLGRRVIWPRSIEISTLKMYSDPDDSPLDSFRIIKINYGWGREKDHESWKAVLKGEAGRKNLTTGYH